MMIALYVAAGSALGGLGRYLLGLWIKSMTAVDGFPYWTLAVNVIGSFLIVLLAGLTSDKQMQAFLLIGLMGGFTTFSSFSMETLQLMKNDQLLLACANIVLSVLLCVSAAYLGHLCTRSA